jgi:hypothetical protein
MNRNIFQYIVAFFLLVPGVVFSQNIKYRVIENGIKKESALSKFDISEWEIEGQENTKKTPPKLIFEKKQQEDDSETDVYQRQEFQNEKSPLKTVQDIKNENTTTTQRKTFNPEWQPSPIIPQLAQPPTGREPHDDEFFHRIIERTMQEAWAIQKPINGIDFYSFLREKLYQEYEEREWKHIEFEEFCERMRLRFTSMHQIFRFAYYNVQSYDRIIKKASRDFRVPEYIIKSIIVQESQGENNVQSWKGAKGLMQLMDTTGAMFDVEDPYDPVQNIRAGTLHFKGLMIQFDGNLELAIAAYNAGGTRVQRYEGVPPFPETQNYVARVTDYIKLYKQIQ